MAVKLFENRGALHGVLTQLYALEDGKTKVDQCRLTCKFLRSVVSYDVTEGFKKRFDISRDVPENVKEILEFAFWFFNNPHRKEPPQLISSNGRPDYRTMHPRSCVAFVVDPRTQLRGLLITVRGRTLKEQYEVFRQLPDGWGYNPWKGYREVEKITSGGKSIPMDSIVETIFIHEKSRGNWQIDKSHKFSAVYLQEHERRFRQDGEDYGSYKGSISERDWFSIINEILHQKNPYFTFTNASRYQSS